MYESKSSIIYISRFIGLGTLICGIIVLVCGIYSTIFLQKVANKRKKNAKPNSKIANKTEEDLVKEIGIIGFLSIVVATWLILQ